MYFDYRVQGFEVSRSRGPGLGAVVYLPDPNPLRVRKLGGCVGCEGSGFRAVAHLPDPNPLRVRKLGGCLGCEGLGFRAVAYLPDPNPLREKKLGRLCGREGDCASSGSSPCPPPTIIGIEGSWPAMWPPPLDTLPTRWHTWTSTGSKVLSLATTYHQFTLFKILKPFVCICKHTATRIRICRGCPAGGRLPHGTCFPALGFALQPVSYSMQAVMATLSYCPHPNSSTLDG